MMRRKRVRELNILQVVRPAPVNGAVLLIIIRLSHGWLETTNPEEVVGGRVCLGEAFQER